MTNVATLPSVVDMPREQYDRLDRVNWSSLKWIGKSPAHYRHNLLTPFEDTDAMKLGRACHLAVFEPERFRSTCVVWDDGPRRGDAWKRFLQRHEGHEVLTADQHEKAVAIGQAARANAFAAPFLSGGKAEQTVLWTHTAPTVAELPGYSFDCRGRLDFVADIGAIVDLKTTKDASPLGFGRQAGNLEYHVQAAWYVDGFKVATGRELPYVIIAVESFAPYVVTVVKVEPDDLELGRERYRQHLDTLNHCRQNNHWPAYAEGPVALALPKWVKPTEEEDANDFGLVINS